MMYNKKFVAVVVCNGKIMREHGGTVYLPFGSNYSLRFKNLHTTKALVSVSIDGEDVLDGNKLIVEPDTSIDLKGFLKGSKARNKFKFIRKTKAISNYRGDRLEDGLIVVRYKFEKLNQDWYPTYPYYPVIYNCNRYFKCGEYQSEFYTTCENNSLYSYANDGITVKGEPTNQQFTYGNIDELEDTEYSIVLQLKGKTKSKRISKPLTVKSKITCGTCGKKNKSFNKYCYACGTYLL